MLRVAQLIWMMLGTVFAGIGIMIVLTVPHLGGPEMKLIPIAALCGFIVAIPFSMAVAKMINKPAGR